MAALQNGLLSDRALPPVGLVSRLDIVAAPTLLRLTMAQIAWGLGTTRNRAI